MFKRNRSNLMLLKMFLFRLRQETTFGLVGGLVLVKVHKAYCRFAPH